MERREQLIFGRSFHPANYKWGEMVSFACAGTDAWIWLFHGFTVAPPRPDVRVDLEGMGSYVLPSPSRLEEFLQFHKRASILQVEEEGYGCCWYD